MINIQHIPTHPDKYRQILKNSVNPDKSTNSHYVWTHPTHSDKPCHLPPNPAEYPPNPNTILSHPDNIHRLEVPSPFPSPCQEALRLPHPPGPDAVRPVGAPTAGGAPSRMSGGRAMLGEFGNCHCWTCLVNVGGYGPVNWGSPPPDTYRVNFQLSQTQFPTFQKNMFFWNSG